MRARVLFLLTLLASWTASCVPQFDDDLSQIAARRVIAVRSVPAEARPGQQVALSVLVAAPEGQATDEQSLSWALCLSGKPLTELGPVTQACIDRFGTDTDILLPLGRGASVTATLPADGCRTFGPLGPPAGADGVAGRPFDPDPSGGYYQPVVLGDDMVSLASPRLSCGVSGVTNNENIKFNSGYRPNENPAITALEWGKGDDQGTLLPNESGATNIVPSGTLQLRVVWPDCPRQAVCGDGLCTSGENQVNCREDCQSEPTGCSGAETYLAGDPASRTVQERREGISVAWFATGGKFASEQTARLESDPEGVDNTNEWTAPSSGPVRLWVVLRDDRGGVGWSQYDLRVDP